MKSEILAAMAEVEGYLNKDQSDNSVFTWKGITYPCIASPGTEGQKFDFGGFGVELDTTLKVRQEVFGDVVPPARKDKITYKGRQLRVETVKIDPLNTVYIYSLVNPAKGV